MALVTADVNWNGFGKVTDADSVLTETWAVIKATAGGGTPSPALADGGLQSATTAQAITTTSNQKQILLYYDIGAGNELDFTPSTGAQAGEFVWVWGNFLASSLLALSSANGFGIMLGTQNGANVDWSLFTFYGSDNYSGGWKRMVIDPTKTASLTGSGNTAGGGGINLASVRYFGIHALTVNTARFDNMVVDRIDVGTGYSIDGTGATTDEFIKDLITVEQTVSNYWGVIQPLNASQTAVELLGKIRLGDDVGTTATTITDVDSKIFAGEPLYYNGGLVASIPLTATGLEIVGNATGATSVTLGKAVGTDAGRNGLTLVGNDTYDVGVDFDDGNVDTLNVYACIFQNLRGTLSWGTNTTHKLFSTTFSGCQQFDPVGGIQIRNSNFVGLAEDGLSDGSNNSALLWNDNINIQSCNFLANGHPSLDVAHGTEHPVATGSPYTYTDLVFNGNEVDVLNSSGSAITISRSGTSNPSTATGSVTFQGSVPITISVVDSANNSISTAEVRVEQTDGTLVSQGSATGGTFSDSYSGTTPLTVRIKVRSSSSGETRYFPVRTSGTIAAGTGLVTTITMTEDTIASP